MRIYRKREERIESGKQLVDGDQTTLINRLQAEDILWHLGFEKSHVQLTIYNILPKIKHEKDGTDFLVTCKDFITEARRISKTSYQPKPQPQTQVQTQPVVEPPANRESGYMVQLSDDAKRFYSRLAKKNDATVSTVIAKLLEAKAQECMEKAINMIKQQALDMAIEEVEL